MELHSEKLWIQNISISVGLVNANTTSMLDAYETFGRAAETKALKVVISRSS